MGWEISKAILATILLISVLAVGLIHLPISANATTSPQPFSIDVYRGDIKNQTSLIAFFNKFTSSRDFLTPVSVAKPTYYKQVTAGNFTLGITKLAQTDSTIAKAKSSNVTYLTYDLEPGAGAEFLNYVNSTATVANKVHAAGLKLILAPRWIEIQNYGTQIAPYADMITMQLRYPLYSLPGGYVSWVSQYSTLLRQSAGHPIVIGEQVLTIPHTLKRINNYDPKDIAVGYNNTKQYIDYIQLFYFNQTYTDNTNTTITKDVIPYLSKFYKETGMLGTS
jgi:hypothetical protein